MNYELITFLSCDFLKDEELLCCDNFDLDDYNQTVFLVIVVMRVLKG